MTTTLQLVTLVACLVVFFKAEPILNQIGRDCAMVIRLAFWLLTAGAAGVGAAILSGWQPTGPVTMALSGIALLLHSERRLESLYRPKNKGRRVP